SHGDVMVAQQQLRQVLAEAKRLGYFDLECEARLALAELQLRSGSASARSQLSSLAADARSRGFNLIAQHAEKTLSSTSAAVAVNRNLH
ncbi:MAG TPA: hypothetical protein VF135_10060, partial [Terriglobales bacterium]